MADNSSFIENGMQHAQRAIKADREACSSNDPDQYNEAYRGALCRLGVGMGAPEAALPPHVVGAFLLRVRVVGFGAATAVHGCPRRAFLRLCGAVLAF